MLEFGVADETAWKVGLSCGGTIRVYVEKVKLKLDILHALNAERAARRAAVARHRRGKRRAAAGRRPPTWPRTRCARLIEKRVRMGKSGMEETAQGRVFLTVHVPSPQLVITGAVHISQTLAPIGADARL